MEELMIKNVNLEKSENLQRHRTEGFSSSKALVVRRGNPFRFSVQLRGRAFNPKTDSLRITVMLGRLYVILPVTFSRKISSTRWKACFDPAGLNLQSPSVFICSPASASVGCYRFQMCLYTKGRQTSCTVGRFTLLFNPWCHDDAVYIPFEDQREEYIQNDSGLLFMGTAMNVVSRPWSFDQYEPGVLETCFNLLQVSPQHQQSRKRDYLNRNNPVYISRVVSAMVPACTRTPCSAPVGAEHTPTATLETMGINSEDDHGVLKGNWSGNFREGVNPTLWTGSGDILRQWSQSGYCPVKYGQCWVFAAVMCTVMRALGIPCRVITNFNSAHDTNGNLVIEEYYSETGQKLNHSKDSIWNFHVWVECWMSRRDLGSDMDGWQVLDPTPQERSRGVFCCGPAPVKAIKNQRMNMLYDIPFVYAEVNADVHKVVLSQGRVVNVSRDTERVGHLICTKTVGFPRLQNITRDYKYIKSPTSTLTSRSSSLSEDSLREAAGGISVFLTLEKTPVAGEPICFAMKISNKQRVAKVLNVHVNAQAKEYNHSPSDTFWENHSVMQLAPMEVKIVKQQILPAQYEDVVGDDLINLAVVLQDMGSHERTLASEEFNITSPQLLIKVADEDNVAFNKQQIATVSFTNPFSYPVSGVLTVSGAGLIQRRIHFRMSPLRPGGSVEQHITFTPSKLGTKMLQANLSLRNINSTIRGFRMVTVKRS